MGSGGDLRRNPQGPDDQPSPPALDHGDLFQVPALLETQALVDPPGGLVMVEVHAQERRDSQPRALFDHPLLEPPADATAVVGGGDVDTDLSGSVVGRPP